MLKKKGNPYNILKTAGIIIRVVIKSELDFNSAIPDSFFRLVVNVNANERKTYDEH